MTQELKPIYVAEADHEYEFRHTKDAYWDIPYISLPAFEKYLERLKLFAINIQNEIIKGSIPGEVYEYDGRICQIDEILSEIRGIRE